MDLTIAHESGSPSNRLLEREQPLALIDETLASARAAKARLVMFEGAAGLGKSRLLEYARDKARNSGVGVLWARGSEIERDYSCGVELQLFAHTVRSLPPLGRRQLLSRLPAAVRALFSSPPDEGAIGEAGELALLHGLLLLTAELAEAGPLMLILDDAHWADLPSLRFLAYLAARLDELTVPVLAARRTGEAGERTALLDHLSAVPNATVQRLNPLGRESVAAVVRREITADADAELCEAFSTLTGGNPFYLLELLRALKEQGKRAPTVSAEALRVLNPDSIARSVLMRIVGLPAGSMELAQAVAILGSGAEPRLAWALAGIDAATASRALDALTAAELLNREQALSFVHPLVAQVITSDIPVHTRGHLHRQAAVLLGAEHADPERVAAHLLAATCAGDSWAVEALRSAGRRAMAHGGTESAVRYLKRALDEPPTLPTRAELLVELGEAEAAAGRPTAPERLEQALALIDDPARRAEVWRIRGGALFVQGRHAEAARAFDSGAEELERLGDNARAREFHAAYVAAATIDPALRTEALSRADRLLVGLPNDLAAADRVILAQAALHHSLAGAPRDFVRDLALRAWDGGALLNDETASGFNWTLISGALYFTDELELALEVCEAAMADARALASPLAFATASYERSLPLFQLGRITAAAADAQAAVDAARYGWSMYSRSALYIQAMCQLERDELDAAAETLAILEQESPDSSIEHPALLDAHAILLRRRGFAREALAEHLEVGRLFGEVFGVHTTGDIAWRLGAAEAALDTGDRDLGATLAAEELTFARKVGLTRGIIGALRVQALAETGERRIALLQEAVAQPEPAPARLEHLRALVELGSALRRANRRADCRAAR
ncbi:MAG: ATP-binding protein, partial [Solirubrobacteraceae bacterium]